MRPSRVRPTTPEIAFVVRTASLIEVKPASCSRTRMVTSELSASAVKRNVGAAVVTGTGDPVGDGLAPPKRSGRQATKASAAKKAISGRLDTRRPQPVSRSEEQ